MRRSVVLLGFILALLGAPLDVTAGQKDAEDAGCVAFAHQALVEAPVGFTAEGIEVLSGCRQAADGTWFVPVGPEDRRLPNGPY